MSYRSYNLSLTDIQQAQQWKMSRCQLSNPAMHKISFAGNLKVNAKDHAVHTVFYYFQAVFLIDA